MQSFLLVHRNQCEGEDRAYSDDCSTAADFKAIARGYGIYTDLVYIIEVFHQSFASGLANIKIL
jgi:hypothetical protein